MIHGLMNTLVKFGGINQQQDILIMKVMTIIIEENIGVDYLKDLQLTFMNGLNHHNFQIRI